MKKNVENSTLEFHSCCPNFTLSDISFQPQTIEFFISPDFLHRFYCRNIALKKEIATKIIKEIVKHCPHLWISSISDHLILDLDRGVFHLWLYISLIDFHSYLDFISIRPFGFKSKQLGFSSLVIHWPCRSPLIFQFHFSLAI